MRHQTLHEIQLAVLIGGATPEELRDTLCLFDPTVAGLGGDPAARAQFIRLYLLLPAIIIGPSRSSIQEDAEPPSSTSRI